MRLGGISNMVMSGRATGSAAEGADATAFSRALGDGSARGGVRNETGPFASDPASYLRHNLTTLGGSGSGTPLPVAKPGETVPDDENIVPFQAHKQSDGSTRLSLNATGHDTASGTGLLAHYLPYTNAGSQHRQGLTTSIKVPAHPTDADPKFVFTPGLSGCAFYGRNNNDGTVTFSHTSPPHGGNVSVPQGAAGTDYGTYGQTQGQPAASVPTALAFAHYNPQQQEWAIHEQRQQLVHDPSSPKPTVILTGIAQHPIR